LPFGSSLTAPVRLLVAAGAVLVLATGCDRVRESVGGDEGPRVLELSHDTIRLAEGVRLHDVVVRRTAQGDFEPATVQARVGDVIRFTADDNGGHALAFDGAALTPEARAWIEGSSQVRSPPLITTGAAWVITLDGAPAGDYPFRCTTHDVAGRLTVGAQ
jgi:plastocyanin